jgi:2-iminobutanoate/2-iminopropanoate deaminase
MAHSPLNAGVAQRIGKYSDGVLAQPDLRWVFTSGTPGLKPDGTCPEGISEQAEWAWRNVLAILEQGGMGVQDLVKVTHYLTRAEDIPAYVAVRARFLGDARPASMLLIVPALVRPELVVEVEAYAARA